MHSISADIRFAVRGLAKSRLFTVVALLSLALGIGANVTVFSIVNTMLLKPLPYREPETLVDVHEWSATQLCDGCGVGTSYATFSDWKASARSFEAMGVYLERPFSVSDNDAAERVGGALVSAETFRILGIAPARGRGFIAEDDRVGAPPVVLLSDGLWTRRYGADPNIIGRTIRVNGVAHTVIGVMPPRFRFPEFADLWVPAAPNAVNLPRDQRDFGVVARLAPGVTLERADAEMRSIGQALAAQHPDVLREWTARVAPLRSAFGDVPPSMYAALLGAVAFVLLIVCANLAGLLLARGAGRQREIAIRIALGASRAQIVRQLLTESLLLALAGGGLGLLAALWGVELTTKAIGTNVPFYIDFAFDTRTLIYCVAVSVATGALFGLLPALRASSPDVHSTLKESGTTISRSRARGVLVIGELALALILLAGTGVLTKSVVRLSMPASGTDELDLLTGNLEFLEARYDDRAAVQNAVGEIVDRLRATPGVANVSAHTFDFIAGFGREDRPIRAEGVDSAVARSASPRFAFIVTPDYFNTVRLPLLSGRVFTAQDRAGSQPVTVINKHMAEVLWPGQSPLGRRIKLGSADSLPWVTVVGVVGDITSRGRITDYAYVPFAQSSARRATLNIRPAGSPTGLLSAVRSVVRAVDPDLPVVGLQTVREQRRNTYWPYQLYTTVFGAFAAFAVLLAAIGLYGVIAYNTAQRTREIGVRIALGATATDIVALVARQGSRLVLGGVLAGLVGASVLLRALRAMLFGASPIDVPVFALVAVVLTGVAATAVWLPARRAALVSPLDALRAE